MDVTQVMFIVAAACNVVAAFFNLYVSRRARRTERTIRETSTKAIGFTAFMASAESGAPDEVRRLASQCLPEGVRIEVTDVRPTRVH